MGLVGYGLDSSGLGQGPMEGYCNAVMAFGLIRHWEFVECVSMSQEGVICMELASDRNALYLSLTLTVCRLTNSVGICSGLDSYYI